ncbi:hypothetical protein JHW43_005211 [Diplocarpon mali]|nr:hypothetical protein JHW43_005211 [Diplocarpon mali]
MCTLKEEMARDLNNPFAVLEGEETSEVHQIPVTNAPLARNTVSKRPPVACQLDEGPDQQEHWTQIIALFNDFVDMRDHISQACALSELQSTGSYVTRTPGNFLDYKKDMTLGKSSKTPSLNCKRKHEAMMRIIAFIPCPNIPYSCGIHCNVSAVKHDAPAGDITLWKDIEAVIRIQGKERVFIGDYPKALDEYHKRGGQEKSFKAWPEISDQRIEHHQYFPGSAETAEPKNDTKETELQTRALTPMAALSLLQYRIQSGIFALNIDYFSLHMRCFDLLCDLLVKLRRQLEKHIIDVQWDHETQLPFLADGIVLLATGSGKAAKAFKLQDTGSITIGMAAVTVKEYINKQGSTDLDRVVKAWWLFDR